MKRVIAATGFAALALSACSGGPAPADTPEPTATEQPSAHDTASVEQYAGKVAALKADWEKWADDWDDSTCSSGAAVAPDCRAHLVEASFMSTNSAIRLSALSDETSEAYLGAPPEEISALYGETVRTAQAAKERLDAWATAGCEGTEECRGEALRAVEGAEDLISTFEEWSPCL